jgi:transcription antitermination factor NusG
VPATKSRAPVERQERRSSKIHFFKSYVFVRITEQERLTVLQTEGILNFVHFLGKPAVIKDEEIETIKSFLLEKDAHISIQSYSSFSQEDKVIIRHGIFMDNTGTVRKSRL